ncbi:MAG: hypothetical protein U0168_27640 [Nannocystaceae bacterium]
MAMGDGALEGLDVLGLGLVEVSGASERHAQVQPRVADGLVVAQAQCLGLGLSRDRPRGFVLSALHAHPRAIDEGAQGLVLLVLGRVELRGCLRARARRLERRDDLTGTMDQVASTLGQHRRDRLQVCTSAAQAREGRVGLGAGLQRACSLVFALPLLRVGVERVDRQSRGARRRRRVRAGEGGRERGAALTVPRVVQLGIGIGAGGPWLSLRDRDAGSGHGERERHDPATAAARREAPQQRRHLGHRREAIGGMPCQAPADRVEERLWWLAGAAARRRLDHLVQLGVRQRHDIATLKWPRAPQQLVQRDEERVLIRARVDRRAQVLLGRHVARRAHDRTGAGEPLAQGVGCIDRGVGRLELALPARQPEVGDLGYALSIEQHVVGLEIAVDDLRLVGRGEALGGGGHHRQHLRPRPRYQLDPLSQGRALDQLHREEHAAAIGRAGVVDRHDVGMGQPRERLGLAQQSRGIDRPCGVGIAADQLDRDAAVELAVVGRDHHAHGARAQRREHDVASDPLAGAGHRRRSANL